MIFDPEQGSPRITANLLFEGLTPEKGDFTGQSEVLFGCAEI